VTTRLWALVAWSPKASLRVVWPLEIQLAYCGNYQPIENGSHVGAPLAQQLELGGLEVEDGHFDPFVARVALFLESRTRVNEVMRLPRQK